jgi:hypothetical protein
MANRALESAERKECVARGCISQSGHAVPMVTGGVA